MRQEILDANRELNLKVFVVWLPVLNGDKKAAAQDQLAILDAPGVAQFYDAKGELGRWFKANVVDRMPDLQDKPVFRATTWDAFFLYGPDAQWNERPTTPLAAGGPIIKEQAVLLKAVRKLSK